MRNKAFSLSLKEKHDVVGKTLASEIMRDLCNATLVTDNLKEDSGDFSEGFWDQKYSLPDGKEVKVEPEMKDQKWWGCEWSAERPFRYEDMDIPYRKVKNKAAIHMVISTCQRLAFVVTRQAMDKALEESGGSPKIKRTIYEPSGAPYFSTPVDRGFFVEKGEDNRWRRWKRT